MCTPRSISSQLPTGVLAVCPLSLHTAHVHPYGSRADAGAGAARLALSLLEEHADRYLRLGVTPNTARSYRTAQSRYLSLCSRFGLLPLSASEQTLILFVAELAQEFAHSSIRSYLSSVWNLHITRGWADPLSGALRLNLLLKGIRRVKAAPPRVKLPVTLLVLHRVRRVLLAEPADPDRAMIWAACCVFFIFLDSCAQRNSQFRVASSTTVCTSPSRM